VRSPTKLQDLIARDARFRFIGHRRGAFSLLAVITIVDVLLARREFPYDVFELHSLGEVWRELSQLWMDGSFDV
jgi:hypothetical protein